MGNGNDYVATIERGERNRTIIAIVLAILGSTGLNQGLQMAFPIRNDPMTGSQAEIEHLKIKNLINDRCHRIEKELDLIKYRLERAGINGLHK